QAADRATPSDRGPGRRLLSDERLQLSERPHRAVHDPVRLRVLPRLRARAPIRLAHRAAGAARRADRPDRALAHVPRTALAQRRAGRLRVGDARPGALLLGLHADVAGAPRSCLAAQAFSKTMPFRTSATSSARSVASSSRPKTSFQRISSKT